MKNSSVKEPSLFIQFLLGANLGMRAKLIILFVIIKVVPLLLIALLAWQETSTMGDELRNRIKQLIITLNNSLTQTTTVAIEDSMEAIADRATKEVERTTTDLANQVASFLYSRDADIRFLANIKPDKQIFESFIKEKTGRILEQTTWVLSKDGTKWEPQTPAVYQKPTLSSNSDNDISYHNIPPYPYSFKTIPLYHEVSFVDMQGKEVIKVTNGDLTDKALKDVSKRENTFIKAETYWKDLQNLKDDEIYVSDVIGAYVPSKIIGSYTPLNAQKRNIPYEPENAAFAGTENPVGKRYKGIVRWAMPVIEKGKRIGYVTLALNHDHIMEMMDHIMPTDERYTEYSDPISGNYAFIWDYKGRSIVHPRHHSIYGFNPETGLPEIPWLEQTVYDKWKASGLEHNEFLATYPTFEGQTTKKKGTADLVKQGLIGLDCRYLNHAPQCEGWFDLVEEGGSGSFLILWSGLTKLTTAAAIPYYTGNYAHSKVGFGFVTVGVGVDDFYRPALETKEELDSLVATAENELNTIAQDAQSYILQTLKDIAMSLGLSTLIMSIIVIIIAIMMASAFTKAISELVIAFTRFRHGYRDTRINSKRTDELGALARAFDDMADAVVETIKEPTAVIDSNRKVIYVNEAGLVLAGRSKEESLGKNFYDLTFYEEGSEYDPIYAMNKGKDTKIQYVERLDKYYQDRAVEIITLSEDGDEEIGYIVSSFDLTDITQTEKRVEEQRRLLNTIFAASPDLMAICDTNDNYLMVNPRYSSLANRPTSEFIGKSIHEMLGEDYGKSAAAYNKSARDKGRTILLEQQFNFADGHSEILETLRTPIYDAQGNPTSLLLNARDVTTRVETEKRLIEIQHSLEDALREANAANSAKSDFLARMSHEIRTPMNAIIGLSTIVQRSLADPNNDPAKTLTQVEHIEKSSKHLLALLNDILDISKIEAGKVEVEFAPFNLDEMINAVDVIVRPRCEAKSISLQSNVDPRIRREVISDSLRLRQVLINMLGNAVKFTDEKGAITLDLRLKDSVEDKMLIEFSITDTGIGIAPENIKKLFTPFEQAEAKTSRVYGGTGLGLSISRSIVNLLGGDITVESIVGQGSTFSFTLWIEISTSHTENTEQQEVKKVFTTPVTPVAPDQNIFVAEEPVSPIPTQESSYDSSTELQGATIFNTEFTQNAGASSQVVENPDAANADPALLSGKRILLADDVELNRMIIVEMLRHLELIIDEVADGTEAVETFANSADGHYDLILMDALMPKMSGYDASNAIRNMQRNDAKSIPIIAVTANAFQEDIDRAMENGMNDHLAKPIDYDKMLLAIKKFLIK